MTAPATPASRATLILLRLPQTEGLKPDIMALVQASMACNDTKGAEDGLRSPLSKGYAAASATLYGKGDDRVQARRERPLASTWNLSSCRRPRITPWAAALPHTRDHRSVCEAPPAKGGGTPSGVLLRASSPRDLLPLRLYTPSQRNRDQPLRKLSEMVMGRGEEGRGRRQVVLSLSQK